MSFYQDASFDLAASELARAHTAKQDSPVILAWPARAYLAADRREPGLQAFRRLQKTAPPGTRLVQDLQRFDGEGDRCRDGDGRADLEIPQKAKGKNPRGRSSC